MTTGTEGNTGGAPAWFEPLDAEVKGYVTTRGLDKKTPVEAFVEAYKSHQEAQKFIGAPADQLLRLPKDANAPEWDGVWERLGKPKEAKDYDFSTVKNADGTPIEKSLEDFLREQSLALKLPKDRAPVLAAALVKMQEQKAALALADKTAKLADEKTELNKNWGTNAAANMVVAKAAAAALGISPETVAALEGVIGYSKIMDMFRTIGTKIGEDRFVTPPGGGAGGVMTRDQALAERKSLMTDDAWVRRHNAGGREETQKMQALNKIISGVAA